MFSNRNTQGTGTCKTAKSRIVPDYISPSALWNAKINYTQISNVNRLHNIIEPIPALFWALGNVLTHIL